MRNILTVDPQLKKILETAANVATSRATVLISGESGCGKELLARYIHKKSARAEKPFVAVNCAALPEGLLESELFGFEKGAFTGAVQRKIGKFELASGGSFLLDEISEMPLLLQAKILRVIQEGEIERLGGCSTVKVDLRLIATSNKDLKSLVEKGDFRNDLFYRLNVVPLFVPPLRERLHDVEILATNFVESSCRVNQRPSKKLSQEAIEKLKGWSWPGNIRELQNVIERSVLLCASVTLSAEDIRVHEGNEVVERPQIRPGITLEAAEKWLIEQTLTFTNRNRTRAAKILGISVRTLRNKIHEYGGLD
ncbi:MAG: sigma-54 dependent transcriptional regulator [Pseudomonadota bacterium]|nr:sigma-54 dependent transcriptional regulator [Pseudomonadota bacterium]